MSFATPVALAGLIAIPLLIVWYVRRQRGRARDRAAFVLPALAPSVAPDLPRWRRHLPMLAFAVALAVLIVALAGPQATRAVPIHNASIMLLADNSSSMAATDVSPTRLVAAERAAQSFLATVPKDVAVGVIVFNQNPTVLSPPTTDHAAVLRALTGWHADGRTAIGDAIQAGLKQLTKTPKASRPPAAMVVLSDGTSTNGADPIAAAKQSAAQKIRIYTVALGTANGTINGGQPVPPDPKTLADIARITGGRAFTAGDVKSLDQVYKRLGSQVATKKQKREVTSLFAGGALALMLLSALSSIRMFGRVL